MSDIYRSRWDVCDECDVAVLVERDDDRGVPEWHTWDGMFCCPECGGSLNFYNADEDTQRETALKQGGRMAYALLVAELRNQADHLGDLDGTPQFAAGARASQKILRDRADHLEAEAAEKRQAATR